MATEPNTGLTWQEPNSLTTDALHNQVIDFVSIWVNCRVLAVGQAAPTGTEVEGDRYIVGTGTGVFAGHDDELAILRGGTWQFHEAQEGVTVRNLADAEDWINEGSGGWAVKAGGGGGTTTTTLVTEASAFTADPATHAGTNKLILAGGDVTFDNAESYSSGQTFNVRATAAIDLIEDGVTLTPPSGGTLELDSAMSVTVVMTGATTGIVIGQTVAA